MPRQELDATTQRSYGLISLILWVYTGHDARSQPRVGTHSRVDPARGWRRDASKPRLVATATPRLAATAKPLILSAAKAEPRAVRGGEEWLGKQPAYHAQHVSRTTFKRTRPHNARGEVSGARGRRQRRADSSKRLDKICNQKRKEQTENSGETSSQRGKEQTLTAGKPHQWGERA